MASSPTLLIYLNSDVGMERPYRTTLPANVDTLSELCQFLTACIPPRPGEDAVGRGYRFLYSVLGKPLWRVKECLDAGTIVLSVGPGFLARRPTAITEGGSGIHAEGDGAASTTLPPSFPRSAAAAAAAEDLTTPDRLAATSRGGGVGSRAFALDASPSASPPVKVPVEDYRSGRTRFATTTAAANATNDATGNARSPPYPAPPAAPGFTTTSTTTAANGTFAFPQHSTATHTPDSIQAAGTAALGGHAGQRDSIDAAWPPEPSVRRASQTDDRDRMVSITLNAAARGHSGSAPLAQSTPMERYSRAAETATTPAVRLFTPPGAAAGAGTYPPAAAPPPVRDGVPRGMVFIGHDTFPLPPRPAFRPPSAAAAVAEAALPHLQPLASSAVSSALQYYLLRKWVSYQKLHSMAPAELIAGEAMSHRFSAITGACSSSTGGAEAAGVCRVVVSGPSRSGVSTTAAFLARHLLRTLQFQPQHALHNTLVLALDFDLLFGLPAAPPQPPRNASYSQQPSPSLPSTSATPPQLLLDVTSLYQLVVRAVMDAVTAQRPTLREAGPLLSQLWDLVVKPNTAPPSPPNFTTYTQAAALVGLDVLARWTRLAEHMHPILQAACRTPDAVELRDAALDFIFYALPAEVAASLNFSGLLYVIDGAESLTRCCADRLTRPAGDLGPLLQALAADPRTHLIVSWPSSLPPRTLFVPGLTAHVSTIGLVTRDVLNHMHFPQVIKSARREYPLEMFLGCPGYLVYLYALTRPFRKNLTVPTTAYSAYYQESYTRAPAEGYALRIDTREAADALAQLLSLVQSLQLA